MLSRTRGVTLRLLALGLLAAAVALPQFIPDKPVIIHPAVESKAEHQGSIIGPGDGLGVTHPAPPPQRPGAARGPRTGNPPPIPPPPPVPQIGSGGAAVEQTSHGTRPAIPPLESFDGLGEGFTGRAFPGADKSTDDSGRTFGG